MANLFRIDLGKFLAFVGKLAEYITGEEVLKLLKHPDVIAAMVATMRQYLVFKLIHGVFNTKTDMLVSFKARCAEKGIDFDKFSWIGSEVAPDFDPDDPETVVVLDATLDTLKATFEFAWEWTKAGQDANWRWDGMLSDADKLRLLSDNRPDDAEGDSPDFKPWTLSWRRIKLNTHVGKKPEDVRDPMSSPGCALLFVAAEHPARIKATDYKTRFGFWLAGLKCTAPGGLPWRGAPRMSFYLGNRGVDLFCGPCGGAGGGLAVPSFRE